ncbi:AMP-dependent synthetase/ligase [Pseudovibrio sp. SPO723]|uniref:AMP-dependent synthetase/ligase n=1 Tax=Nesiotobacter zosterae TaxID=392721 RepID=UPI0029C2C873|nr:AMP-dependent synthetase/ligase [Pseudovibrio sp. SPO723]MDX5593523.1 AMP-dependent synthetase/ligase [Pseudovibrio sp. SPO723]
MSISRPNGAATSATDGFVSIPVAFLNTAKRLGSDPAYYVRGTQVWEPTSWTGYAEEVCQAARALIASGVRPGDTVCILSYNRPEWAITDLAAMMIGAAPTGIYWTASLDEVRYILRHSEGRVLVVEDEAQLAQLEEHLQDFPHLRRIVRLNGSPASDLELDWQSFMELGAPLGELEEERQRRLARIEPEDIALQIYTSGTTGKPKAVQLSHRALREESNGLTSVQRMTNEDRYLCYLPLAHVAEQVGTIIQHSDHGYRVYFARSIPQVPEDLREVRPSIFFGVPRVYEKMMVKIQERLDQAEGFKKRLALWSLSTMREWYERRIEGRATGPLLDFKAKIAKALVIDKVQRTIGFDQQHIIISGGAPLPVEVQRFFLGLGVVLRVVYGMSETCGATTFNSPENTRIGSVGKPIEGMEVKIAEDGEILCRGGANFTGYSHDPEATDEVFDDGWLRTGDIGYIDSDGYLFITGRKKDIIVTSGGKNIAPAKLEGLLGGISLIEYSVVVGNNRNYLGALLSLDPQALAEFAEARGIASDKVLDSPELHETLSQGIERVNASVGRAEQIRGFQIIRDGLSINAGELTATMKVRRAGVLDKHGALVDKIYAS